MTDETQDAAQQTAAVQGADTATPAIDASATQADDPNGAASNAAAPSTGAPTASAEAAPSTAGASPSDGNSDDESLTFEERVEKRFVELEHFLLKLPRSIMHALHGGSGTPEEVAQRATQHLLDKNQ
ncbi:hypothetical protein [Candidimonas nitroreducens]|uniref:Uncharacterized protein n=1 Tax=Candidimonas nitroreducens TaxID=683354 RepID=A0A225MLC3_9BURK|nr:hypothetical protein [Candidimonas nitroreducens]OWT62018.1 hypothetical protein CEY11_09435 [Candidimonas nitroreducens]